MKILFDQINDTYEEGDVFCVHSLTKFTCVLVQVGKREFCLINMKSWNRIADPIKINHRPINSKDIKMLSHNCDFSLIAKAKFINESA